MKKWIAVSMLFVLSAVPAHAREITGPDAARHEHRSQLIEQRKQTGGETRIERRAKVAGEKKDPTFWDREGERSGLNRFGAAGMGEGVKKLNPIPWFQKKQEEYNARKSGSAK